MRKCTFGDTGVLASEGGLAGWDGFRPPQRCLWRAPGTQSTASLRCRVKGLTQGGSEGDDSWSTEAATVISKKSGSFPRVVCGDFLPMSHLLCSCSTSPGLQHHSLLSKSSASQTAMLSVRRIIFIQMIILTPIKGTALRSKRFRQRDLTFTLM